MFARVLSVVACVALLGACSYSQIDPEKAKSAVRDNNGHHELGAVSPGTAKLVMRSIGQSFPVQYSISTSPKQCEAFESIGKVTYFAGGVVYPWIARAAQRGAAFYLVREIEQPDRPIQVRALAPASSDQSLRRGPCGPLAVQFTPQAGHAYTAEFVWRGLTSCELQVMDATAPDSPKAVPAVPLPSCQ